jgi:CheY-like chemotaxis protein
MEAGAELRALVTFRPLNLIGAWPIQKSFDVIFCRNVVIYFDGETQAALWPRFRQALRRTESSSSVTRNASTRPARGASSRSASRATARPRPTATGEVRIHGIERPVACARGGRHGHEPRTHHAGARRARDRECGHGVGRPVGAASLSASPVHLVISDYNMPEMDGLQLLQAMRTNPATQRTGFLLITGRADGSVIDRGKGLGMNNYIKKPFTAGRHARRHRSRLRAALMDALPQGDTAETTALFAFLAETLGDAARRIERLEAHAADMIGASPQRSGLLVVAPGHRPRPADRRGCGRACRPQRRATGRTSASASPQRCGWRLFATAFFTTLRPGAMPAPGTIRRAK